MTEYTPEGVPAITDEQRREYLSQAAQARHERYVLLKRIKAGEVDPRGVLMRKDRLALRTRTLRFIESWPGYGPAKAQALMDRLGICSGRRLGGLGSRQRQNLMDEMPPFRKAAKD